MKSKGYKMKRVLGTLAAMTVFPILSWLGGYDFNVRGEIAVAVASFSIMFGAIIFYHPGWKNE